MVEVLVYGTLSALMWNALLLLLGLTVGQSWPRLLAAMQDYGLGCAIVASLLLLGFGARWLIAAAAPVAPGGPDGRFALPAPIAPDAAAVASGRLLAVALGGRALDEARRRLLQRRRPARASALGRSRPASAAVRRARPTAPSV